MDTPRGVQYGYTYRGTVRVHLEGYSKGTPRGVQYGYSMRPNFSRY